MGRHPRKPKPTAIFREEVFDRRAGQNYLNGTRQTFDRRLYELWCEAAESRGAEVETKFFVGTVEWREAGQGAPPHSGPAEGAEAVELLRDMRRDWGEIIPRWDHPVCRRYQQRIDGLLARVAEPEEAAEEVVRAVP